MPRIQKTYPNKPAFQPFWLIYYSLIPPIGTFAAPFNDCMFAMNAGRD
jgi:hypothetical protein